MKRYLLMMTLILGLVISCMPKEVALPNKNLKYEKGEITHRGKVYKGVVTYKGQPYTGKIATSAKEKLTSGWSGFINLKDGHLDGMTEVKNTKGEYTKFNVINSKFDGEYAAKMNKTGNVTIFFKDGRPESTKIEMKTLTTAIKQDFTIDADGKINGEMTAYGSTIIFKDGAAEVNGMTMKLYLNDKNKIITEIYQGDKLIQKDEPKNSLVPELLEKLIFPTMINGEKMDMSLVI